MTMSNPNPCKYFTNITNNYPNATLDACAIGVFAAAGGGAIVLIALYLMCIGIGCCCWKSSKRKSRTRVQRGKPLATSQATSWFTSSLTSKLFDTFMFMVFHQESYNYTRFWGKVFGRAAASTGQYVWVPHIMLWCGSSTIWREAFPWKPL